MPLLDHELARFQRELPQLARTMRGQFVLIHKEDPVAGPYKTEDEAYEAGSARYGLEPFLVMLVDEHEKPIPLPPHAAGVAMTDQGPKDEWLVLEATDPPPDLSREEATFQRERERLVRDHLGKIAVIRFDEVVGVYDDVNQAIIAAHERFGWGRMIFCEITACDEPAWVSNVDVNHPCVRRLD